ncbi:MAG: hypothetical protein KDA99_26070, partial [Planctomycetales bacterium]|nr:hypothetical protein [Planctomycetales bacterium]
ALRVGDYKLIKYEGRTSYALFNIVDDPGERVNLANQQPDLLQSMIAQLQTERERLSRLSMIPEQVNDLTIVPFDPRLDISGGEATILFSFERPADIATPVTLFQKPDSWSLVLDTNGALQLNVTGVDVVGHPLQTLISTAPVTATRHEVMVLFGGFKNDETTIDIYVDGALAAAAEESQRPWNVWSSTSDLRIGDARVAMSDIRMHLTRLYG